MVLHLLEQGVEVVAWNRSPEPRQEVAEKGAIAVETLEELVASLRSDNSEEKQSNLQIATSPSAPRNDSIIIWLMLPAGETTDEYIEKLIPLLNPEDLLIDGGNSFYQDTLRRAEKLKNNNIRFMDIGTSGGPGGARNGACLMIGGEKADYEQILPLVEKIAAPEAYGLFGSIGAGHFAKMIHNGIEYGMMEAIAEGLNILDKSQFNMDLKEIFRVYNTGSVIESRLVGWTLDALKEDPTLSEYSAKIGHNGEGEWTVKVAEEAGLDARVIKDSFDVRLESDKIDDTHPDALRNKAVSAMRGKFGGHAVKKDA